MLCFCFFPFCIQIHHPLFEELQHHRRTHIKQHTELFRINGCYKSKQRQQALKRAHHELNAGKLVRVRVNKEPDNPKDKNAIAFEVQFEGSCEWNLVGYVPLAKIPKVRCAMDGNEISNMTLLTPTFFYQNVPAPAWYSKVILTKSGAWGSDDLDNTYRTS